MEVVAGIENQEQQTPGKQQRRRQKPKLSRNKEHGILSLIEQQRQQEIQDDQAEVLEQQRGPEVVQVASAATTQWRGHLAPQVRGVPTPQLIHVANNGIQDSSDCSRKEQGVAVPGKPATLRPARLKLELRPEPGEALASENLQTELQGEKSGNPSSQSRAADSHSRQGRSRWSQWT